MALAIGNNEHVFGRLRPNHSGTFPVHLEPERDTHFRPLPEPTGNEPYHLDLGQIIPAEDFDVIRHKRKLTFHLNGDMGGVRNGEDQKLVARGMEADFDPAKDASENPAFLYITGDCVYFNGEVKEYYTQFYEPYELYPRPIFAVPGNHDGENLPDDDSLKGFVRNFCATNPVKMPESGDSQRTAMTQPNVYWVLRTPLANFVGLYSNVPAGGEIQSPQKEWLVEQLSDLPRDAPLFVALHHPVYSADNHHSGSTYMKKTLEAAFEAANRLPDMVLAGHVHAYERITKKFGDKIQPHLVTGAGGYHNLHNMMKKDGQKLVTPVVFTNKDANDNDEVILEKYSDDHHGFLRLEITEDIITGKYYEVPRSQEPYSKGNQLMDHFDYDWKNRQYITNHL